MERKNLGDNFFIVSGISLILVLSSTNAFAQEWQRELPRRHEVAGPGHRQDYSKDRFYNRGLFFGLRFFFVSPHIGAVVRTLPSGHRTIIAAGTPYYYYNNVYYANCPNGYVIVPEPVINANTVVVPSNTQVMPAETIINVPNSNGSYTAVRLAKRDGGYVGPQGEFYPGNPTIEQLKALYGK